MVFWKFWIDWRLWRKEGAKKEERGSKKEERGSKKEERGRKITRREGAKKGGKRENARETIPEHSELPEKPIHQPLNIQHSAFSIQH